MESTNQNGNNLNEKLGEKVYKKVTVDGKTISKWVVFEEMTEYNEYGKPLCYGDSDGTEGWYDHDENGNEIHYKNNGDYDARGNEIHFKNNHNREWWFEYTFHENGKVKTKKKFNSF